MTERDSKQQLPPSLKLRRAKENRRSLFAASGALGL